MKGNPKVIKVLNELLVEELTAINQYFVHSEICESYGYGVLHGKIRAESMDEMKHAEVLLERILFLGGKPTMGKALSLTISEKVEQMLANDLVLEQGAIASYNAAIALCAELGDNGSSDLLQTILTDEEKHLEFIETQLSLIKQIGLPNYLAQQMGEGKD